MRLKLRKKKLRESNSIINISDNNSGDDFRSRESGEWITARRSKQEEQRAGKMPLPKRLVEPVHVARGTIPEDFPLPSELEAATNGTLANTIRQLSSLSRHAEDLFGELAREAHGLSDRANSLQARIDRLAVKVTQLDSNVEEGTWNLLVSSLVVNYNPDKRIREN